MNIIIDRLTNKIGEYQIMPDFRNMIRLEILPHDPEGWGDINTALALSLLYPARTHDDGTEYVDKPANTQEAIDGLLWFYRQGERDTGSRKGKKIPDH